MFIIVALIVLFLKNIIMAAEVEQNFLDYESHTTPRDYQVLMLIHSL